MPDMDAGSPKEAGSMDNHSTLTGASQPENGAPDASSPTGARKPAASEGVRLARLRAEVKRLRGELTQVNGEAKERRLKNRALEEDLAGLRRDLAGRDPREALEALARVETLETGIREEGRKRQEERVTWERMLEDSRRETDRARLMADLAASPFLRRRTTLDPEMAYRAFGSLFQAREVEGVRRLVGIHPHTGEVILSRREGGEGRPAGVDEVVSIYAGEIHQGEKPWLRGNGAHGAGTPPRAGAKPGTWPRPSLTSREKIAAGLQDRGY